MLDSVDNVCRSFAALGTNVQLWMPEGFWRSLIVAKKRRVQTTLGVVSAPFMEAGVSVHE